MGLRIWMTMVPHGRRIHLILLMFFAVGCGQDNSPSTTCELVFGKRGFGEARFQRPRAIAIDKLDQLYIVDMTGRIQVFDTEGSFKRSWRIPAIENGKPTGLSIDHQGNLMVADTHYFRVLFYHPQGILLEDQTIGGTNGTGPGEFNFLTDVVQDSKGNYYISEYGEYDRIQKFSPDKKYLFEWGGHGQEPGQFMRPQSLAVDENDLLYVADACNHRIQIFDARGESSKLVSMWGTHGEQPGQLRYPYGMILSGSSELLVCEYGNHRIQKFTRGGKHLGTWGRAGRDDGEFNQPWSLIEDSKGRIFVLDSYNHRVQRLRLTPS